jgi:hypothetical protein
MRDNGSDPIVLFQNGSNGSFDVMVAVDELYFAFEDGCAECANMLDFFLQVHQLKSSGIFYVADGFCEPEWQEKYMLWKSWREMRRLGC